MKEPTQEQIKELWEWCGLELHLASGGKYCWFESGEAHTIVSPVDSKTELPVIDLNSLFEYAVPKAIDKIMAEQECSSDLAYAILFKKWLQKLELDIPNYEGTLFWAIWEVINATRKRYSNTPGQD